jgi:hypothetical protein
MFTSIESFNENLSVGPNGISDNHNNVGEILPNMVRISNNSRITQETAAAIAKKLDAKEFRDFATWLRIAIQHT